MKNLTATEVKELEEKYIKLHPPKGTPVSEEEVQFFLDVLKGFKEKDEH